MEQFIQHDNISIFNAWQSSCNENKYRRDKEKKDTFVRNDINVGKVVQKSYQHGSIIITTGCAETSCTFQQK